MQWGSVSFRSGEIKLFFLIFIHQKSIAQNYFFVVIYELFIHVYEKSDFSREKYDIRAILVDFLSEFPKILQLLTIYIHSSLKISAQHR